MLVSVLVALIAYAFMRTWSGHVSGLDGLVSFENLTKTWLIGNNNYAQLPLCGHFNGGTSFELMHKKLSQLSRRIRQRRAAQRRAQRKARGTLLTALRPVSHCWLWSWVLFVIQISYHILIILHVFNGKIHVLTPFLWNQNQLNISPPFSGLETGVILPRYWQHLEFPSGEGC